MTATVNQKAKRNRETPHDKFVKCALKNQVIAIDFLAAHWSEIGLGRQELSSITLSNNEHNEPGKPKLQSDVVYRGGIAAQEYIFLLEHQSRSDKNMLFRFAEYTLPLIKEHSAQKRQGVPLVLPLCLYHHPKRQKYRYPTTLGGYFVNHRYRDEALLGYGFKLVDLTVMTDEEIATHGNAALMEWLLRDAFLTGDAWIERAAQHLAHPLSIMACKRCDPFKKASLEYILARYRGGKTVDEVEAVLRQALPQEEQGFMATALQKLEQRGEQKGVLLGIQQGMQHERQQIARNLLNAGINLELVKQTTNLSYEELSQLYQGSVD